MGIGAVPPASFLFTMPLPAPVPDREELHLRRIEMRGFQRTDGLFDIEGRIVDTKSYPFRRGGFAALLEPGVPLHDMWVRLTLDQQLLIHEVAAVTDASPYDVCPQATASMANIKGLRIAKGWAQTVKDALPPTEACTHLREILTPMATAAFQTVIGARMRRGDGEGNAERLIDTCLAYRRDGDVVAVRFPEYSTRG
jgi:hypothetical protein